ncbi:hypothetical protein DAI22_09g027800 [Oryza sativa Japonica Group]|nr:hypothetical protein DAI22_09g027800 [Oryza sativa Japonica Group]
MCRRLVAAAVRSNLIALLIRPHARIRVGSFSRIVLAHRHPHRISLVHPHRLPLPHHIATPPATAHLSRLVAHPHRHPLPHLAPPPPPHLYRRHILSISRMALAYPHRVHRRCILSISLNALPRTGASMLSASVPHGLRFVSPS